MGVSGQGGFTLLEALIAFAIAALALSVLFEGASAALRETGSARMLAGATLRAQSHLAEAGVLLGGQGERVEQGDDGPRYRWRVTITPAPSVTVSRQAQGVSGPPLTNRLRLYRIVAEERWSERGRPHALRLRTSRLSVGPPGAS